MQFMSAISHLIAPIVTNIIQKIVVTVSFGLAPGELNFAYVYVDEYLELEGLQRNQVVHWNVQVRAWHTAVALLFFTVLSDNVLGAGGIAAQPSGALECAGEWYTAVALLTVLSLTAPGCVAQCCLAVTCDVAELVPLVCLQLCS